MKNDIESQNAILNSSAQAHMRINFPLNRLASDWIDQDNSRIKYEPKMSRISQNFSDCDRTIW